MTPIETQLLALLKDRVARGEPTPTMSEMARELGFANRSTVHGHIQSLLRQGLLVHTGERRRPYLPADPMAADLKQVPTELLRAEIDRRGRFA